MASAFREDCFCFSRCFLSFDGSESVHNVQEQFPVINPVEEVFSGFLDGSGE